MKARRGLQEHSHPHESVRFGIGHTGRQELQYQRTVLVSRWKAYRKPIPPCLKCSANATVYVAYGTGIGT